MNEKRLRPEITNKICKRLWELAQIEPERTRGSLKGQVDCANKCIAFSNSNLHCNG